MTGKTSDSEGGDQSCSCQTQNGQNVAQRRPTATPVPGALRFRAGESRSPNPTVACKVCGGQTPREFPFCQHCGRKVDSPSQPIANPGRAKPKAKTVSTLEDKGSAEDKGWAGLALILADGTVEEPCRVLKQITSVGGVAGDTADICFADELLRGVHFHFHRIEDGSGTVTPANSKSGVFMRVEKTELDNGDEFLVGSEVFRFETVDPSRQSSDKLSRLGSPVRNPWGRLTSVDGRGKDCDVRFLINRTYTIGREQGDILLPDDEVLSKSHAEISGPSAFLSDLNSLNGSFVRLRKPTVVKRGDVLRLGSVILRITE